ncbi:MAG: DNA double-strand break repair nuclease NurA [Thermoproteota archaeon]
MLQVIDVGGREDLDSVLRGIVQRVEVRRSEVRRKLAGTLGIKSIGQPTPPSSFDRVYAVDSAYPTTPLELLGVSLSLISVALVVYLPGSRETVKSRRIKLLVDYEGGMDIETVSGMARLEERRLLLSQMLGTGTLIAIDGEVAPSGQSPLWRSARNLTMDILNACAARSCTVVGILKRSRSRILASVAGVSVNDRVAASAALERGEYVEVEHPSSDLSSAGCRVVFYKPWRGPPHAVKAEVCCSGSHCVEAAVKFLASESSGTGLPWFLDLVDAVAKSGVSILTPIYRRLLSLSAGSGGPDAAMPANPQEALRWR